MQVTFYNLPSIVGSEGNSPQIPVGRENEATYFYLDGFPNDGRIPIPSIINRNDLFEMIIADNSGLKEGYIIPDSPLFGKVISRFNPGVNIKLVGKGDAQRFSVAPSPESPRLEYLNLPHPRVLLIEVFRELGYSVHPASTHSFIDLFPGLKEAGEFLSKPYAITMIERMADSEFKTFGTIRNIISRPENLDSVETSKELLEMLRKRILLRGFLFQCTFCNLQDFYFMKEVDETFFCKGCRKENTCPLQLPSAAKLNRMVQDSYRHGAIATILTLHRLFLEAKKSFIYAPELNLKRRDGEMEIDFVCIIDGEVVIGEAKMGRLIKDRDFSPRDEFEKYKKIAKAIGASRVVFSTIQDSFYDIPLSKIDRFRRELADEGIEAQVDIMNKTDLLAREFYPC